jgi:MGT family glycosyltransferase
MARILLGTFPHAGHVNPFLPLVRALVARGHEVVWNTSAKLRERVEATGARLAPFERARDFLDYDPQEFAPGKKLSGTASLKLATKHVFIDNAPRHMQDLDAISRTFRPDMLLCDPGFIGASWYHQRTGLPLAILNVLPMALSSRDTPPSGIGLTPGKSPFERMRNTALTWAIENVLFRDVQQHWNAVRAATGLPPTGWFQDTATDCELYMQPTVPSFEFPRSDLVPHAHFIGAMPAATPLQWERPAWWDELDGGRPIVHVTQGTVANERPTLIAPTLEGLADEEVLVVATTGGRPLEEMGLGPLPKNARVASFLSYPELLPRTAAMVTNGGYGGTQQALSFGIPLVVAGTTEDKPEVAARVAWAGVGHNLHTDAPRPEQVRDAVRSLLADGDYRQRARALAAEYARYDAVAMGVALIERVAATGRPVLRGETEAQPAAMPLAVAR